MKKIIHPNSGLRARRDWSRRRFLTAGAGAVAGASLFSAAGDAARAAKKTSDSVRGRIKITDIEAHEITEESIFQSKNDPETGLGG